MLKTSEQTLTAIRQRTIDIVKLKTPENVTQIAFATGYQVATIWLPNFEITRHFLKHRSLFSFSSEI